MRRVWLGCLNSGPAAPCCAGQHHVHRRPPGAAGGEDALGLAHHLGLGLADLVGGERGADSVLVQPEALLDRGELLLGLDRPGGVEALVPRNGDVGERPVVAHGHHVVEPVDADLPEPAVGDPLAGVLGEDLVLDPGLAVVADPPRLLREDHGRVALDREDDVRVAVQEPEAGEVADCPLEPGVLGAGDDDGVQAVLLPPARGRSRSGARSRPVSSSSSP